MMLKLIFSKSSVRVLSIFLLVTSGCSSGGQVEKDSNDAVREFAIIPLFPFRENVQVGDMYEDPAGLADLDPNAPAPPGNQPIGLWLYSMNLSPELTDFYAARLSFPATTRPTTQATPTAQTATTKPANIFGPGNDVGRLRVVAFPSFATHSITNSDISAVVPVKTAASITAVGGSASSQTVSLSVPEAEAYGLPATTVLNKLLSIPKKDFDAMYIGFHGLPSANNPSADLYIRVITEVYYARQINLNIASSNGQSLGLAAKLNPALLGGTPSTGTIASPSVSIPNAATSQPTADSLTTALNKDLQQNGGDTAPGVKFTYTAASDSSVTLQASFDRPVAIGFRGFMVVVKSGMSANDSAQVTVMGTLSGIFPGAINGTVASSTAMARPATQK